MFVSIWKDQSPAVALHFTIKNTDTLGVATEWKLGLEI